MSKVTDPSFKFWYDPKWYTVQGAETMIRIGTKDNMSTMRSEYTRMRDVAQKRIKRLGMQFPDSQAYKQHSKGFPKLKELDKRDFAKAFSDLYKFVSAKGSTVTGQKQIKQKTINTWQKQGLNLNNKNYDTLIKVLNKMRADKLIYGSDKAVSVADMMLELSSQQQLDWLQHLDDLLSHPEDLEDFAEEYKNMGNRADFDEIAEEFGW